MPIHRSLFFGAILAMTPMVMADDTSQSITQNGPEVVATGSIKVGEKPPSFSLPTLSGKNVNFPEDYAGQVVIVNFWATWCSPCVEEIPSLERLRRQLKGTDVRVLTININDGEEKDVAALLDKSQAHFVTALDPGGKMALTWGTSKLPETYIINPDGTLHSKIIGAQVWDRGDRVHDFKGMVKGQP